MDFLLTGGQGCVPFSKGPHCPGQTDDEYRTTFALWSLTQSPMIVATDIRNMTPVMEQTLLNKELVSLHQSTATPPGKHLAYWECSELLGCEVWGRKIANGENSWMVALVNRGKKTHRITVKWSDLGISKSTPATITNIWDGTLKGNATGQYTDSVPSHGTIVLKIVA